MSLKIEYPVSAETIYNHLGIKTPLKAWFKSKCEQLGLKEGLDYHGYCMNTLALHLLTAKLNMVERCRLGGYVSDLNDKAMFEDIFSS